jgi:hypothetical protein
VGRSGIPDFYLALRRDIPGWRVAAAQLNRGAVGANIGLTNEGFLREVRISEANVVLFLVLGYAWHRQI